VSLKGELGRNRIYKKRESLQIKERNVEQRGGAGKDILKKWAAYEYQFICYKNDANTIRLTTI
jgi:hypothetical protein